MRKQLLRSWQGYVSIVIAVTLVLGPHVTGAMAAGPAGNVLLRGVVASADKGTPIAGARVYAVHLDSKEVFSTSTPTNARGEYQITGLPFGYYDVAVETPEGLYLANRVINAPAGEKIEISLILGPPQPEDTEWWSAEPDRRIPGLERVPDGVARIIEGRPTAAKIVAAKVPAGTAGKVAASAAGAGGAASWLAPLLAGAGIAILGVVVDRQNDTDREFNATPFEPTK